LSLFYLPTSLKNDKLCESIVLFHIVLRTPKHSRVSSKMTAKFARETSSTFKRNLDDTLVESASGKASDQFVDRLASEQKALKKKLTKKEKESAKLKSEMTLPKTISENGTKQKKIIDFSGDIIDDVDESQVRALLSEGEIKDFRIQSGGVSRSGLNPTITVKELGRQGVVKTSNRKKKEEVEADERALQRRLDKAAEKGLKFARSAKKALQEDDALKRAANNELLEDEKKRLAVHVEAFQQTITILEREQRKAALKHKHDMNDARVISNRVNREAQRAGKHERRAAKKAAEQKASLDHFPVLPAKINSMTNFNVQDDGSFMFKQKGKLYHGRPAKYYGPPKDSEELPVTQGDCDDDGEPVGIVRSEAGGRILSSPFSDFQGPPEEKQFSPPVSDDDEDDLPNPYADDESEPENDVSVKQGIPFTPPGCKNPFEGECEDNVIGKGQWKDFCLVCCKSHKGLCSNLKFRRVPFEAGSYYKKVEDGAEAFLKGLNVLCDDSRDSESVRNIKSFFSVAIDVIDILYMVLYSDETCTRIATRHFVERYIDTKDIKYSRMISILTLMIYEVRKFFWGKSIEYSFIESRLNAFCRKYKYTAFLDLVTDDEYDSFSKGKKEERKTELPQTQGVMDDLLGIFKGITNNEFFNSLFDLLTMFVSIKTVNDFLPEGVREHLRPKKKMNSFYDVVECVLTALASIERYFHSWISGTPLKDLVFAEDPLLELQNKIKKLMVQKDYLYSGLPVPGYRCIKDYLGELENVVETIPMFLKKTSPWRNQIGTLRVEAEKLNIILGQVQARIRAECRRTPFAVLFSSPPGTGKSNVLRITAAIHCEVMGREWHEGLIYPRSRTSQYWEGYLPLSHPYVFYSEMGTTHETIAKNVVDERLIEMTSVVDNLLMYCDMAFEGKGKTACSPEAVFIDTNKPDINLKWQVNNVAAFKRRWITVTPVVKPEYRALGCESMDYAKTKDGSRFLDKWYFRVVRHQAADAEKVKEQILLDGQDENSNIDAYCDLMRTLIRDHVEKETALQRERDAISTEDYKLVHAQAEEEKSISQYDKAVGIVKDVGYKLLFASKETKGLCDSVVLTLWSEVLENVAMHRCMSLCFALLLFYVYVVSHVTTMLWDVGYYSLYCWIKFWEAVFMYFLYLLIHRYTDLVTRPHIVRRAAKGVWARFLSMTKKETQESDIVIQGSSAHDYRSLAAFFVSTIVGGSAYVLGSKLFESMKTKDKLEKDDVSKVQVTQGQSKASVDSSGRVKTSDSVKSIEVMEEKVDAGFELKRVNNTMLNTFNTWDTRYVESLSTSSESDFAQKCMRNVRYISVHTSKTNRAFALGIKSNYAIFNNHLLSGGKEGFVRVYPSLVRDDTCYQEFQFREGDYVSIGNDLVVMRMPVCRFTDLTDFINSNLDVSFADGYVANSKTRFFTTEQKVNDPNVGEIMLFDAVRYGWKNNKGGHCGLPLTCSIGKRNYLIGIHGAASAGTEISFGPLMRKDKILQALDLLKTTLPNVVEASSQSDVLYDVVEPLKASPIYHICLRSASYYGKLNKPVLMARKSTLVPTGLGQFNDQIFSKLFPKEIFNEYGPPLMTRVGSGDNYVNPFNVFLSKTIRNKKSLSLKKLDPIIAYLVERAVAHIKRDDKDLRWKPLSVNQAINGVPDDAYVRKMDLSTSAGMGYPGKKKRYFEGNQPDAIPNEEVVDAVSILLTQLSLGDGVPNMFEAQLKDEPRLMEKVKAGKTRVFCTSTLPSLIVQRMFLGPFFSTMIEHSEIFGTAIGYNMHIAGEKIWSKMISHSDLWMEGDYSGYDQMMPVELAIASASVVFQVCEKMGYNDEALTVLEGVLTDQVYPLINVCGDIFSVPGYQPSGKYGTAEDNSLRGLILLMYHWSNRYPIEDFFQGCIPLIYGDDMLVSVKQKYSSHMNNSSYAEFIERETSMTFTSADKDKISSDFVAPRKTSFLKRRLVKRAWFDNKSVAALSADSLKRSMDWMLPSKFESPLKQMIGTLNAMLRELLFHFPPNQVADVREKYIDELARVFNVTSDEICMHVVPTLFVYKDLFTSQLNAESKIVVIGEEPHSFIDYLALLFGGFERAKAIEMVPQTQADSGVSDPLSSCQTLTDTSLYLIYLEEIDILNGKLNRLKLSLTDEFKTLDDVLAYKDTDMYLQDPNERDRIDLIVETFGQILAIQSSISIFVKRLKQMQRLDINTQSLPEVAPEEVPSERKDMHVNAMEFDGASDTHDEEGYAPYVKIFSETDADLKNFFARPILLATNTISMVSAVNFSFNVWDLYFKDPTVRAKLRNFSMIRAKLCVKLSVAGTPYHKGSLLVAYIPLPTTNSVYTYYSTSAPAALSNNYNKWLAQTPGNVKMDVRLNQPLVFEFPFVSPSPACRLYNNSTTALSDVSSYNDLASLGTLVIRTLNSISAVSAGVTSPYFYLYAWLEEVELGPPSASVIVVTTQGDNDERVVGPVERVSSSMYSIAYALRSIPTIGPFAHASSIVLRGLRDLSAHFGWSVPTVIDRPMRVRPEPFQNAANVIGNDTGHRITLDPKQEISVDPRRCGTDSDDLVISTLARKDGILDQYTWNVSATPMLPLWYTFVVPNANRPTVNTFNYVQPTPLHFAATPFSFWRGKLRYKITFFPSAFHRGKVGIFAEPNCNQVSLIGANFSLNKNFLAIVDLQTTSEIEVCIDWAFPRFFARMPSQAVAATAVNIATNATLMPDFANGWISVVPLTKLVSPDGSGVDFNVYVSADEIEFAYPDQTRLPTIVTQGDSTYDQRDSTCITLNPTGCSSERAFELHFGERLFSFRSLLKRFVTTDQRIVNVASIPGNQMIGYTGVILPTLSPSVAASATYTSLLSYLRPAYLGMTGGIRKRLRLVAAQNNPMNCVTIQLLSPYPVTSIPSIALSTAPIDSIFTGTVMFAYTTNGGIEFEVPFYTSNLFGCPSLQNIFDNSLLPNFDPNALRNYLAFFDVGSTGTFTLVELTATAEDFCLHRFIAAAPFSY